LEQSQSVGEPVALANVGSKLQFQSNALGPVWLRLSLGGVAHMNVFTTGYPLTSQPSWFDACAHPFLSFVSNAFVSALILTPLVLVRLYHYAISDIGAEPNLFPDLG
jgi:hypothetical protein